MNLLSVLLTLAGAVQAAAPGPPRDGAAAALTRIGAAAAVSGKVLIQSKGEKVGKVVASGRPVFLNDHVTTGPGSRLQVMLLDQTVFTLGPNSDMVLDEFVYDPETSAGKMTANVVKGTFRFVSGKIAQQNAKNVNIKLPTGTMGIRGTITMGQATPGTPTTPPQSTAILLGPGATNNAGETPGAIVVGNGRGEVTIDQPGFGTTMSGDNPPSPPSDMSGTLNIMMGEVGGGGTSGGKSGGTKPATTSKAASSDDDDDDGGGGGNGSSGGSASEESGEDTASGSDSAGVSTEADAASSEADSAGSYAAFDAAEDANQILDGTAFWAQLGTITSGEDWWTISNAGSYSCSGGGTCATPVTGTISLNLVIDWNTREVGGHGGSSQLTLDSSGGFSGDSAQILAHPFGSEGQAILSLGTSNFGARSNGGDFAGTTITLINAEGIVARDVRVDVQYTGSAGETASGSIEVDERVELPPQ